MFDFLVGPIQKKFIVRVGLRGETGGKVDGDMLEIHSIPKRVDQNTKFLHAFVSDR